MSAVWSWCGLSRRVVLLPAITMLLGSQSLLAQSALLPAAQDTVSPAKLREYEVVSIKENKSGDGNVSWRSTPDGFITVNMTLNNLIANAYGVRSELISGGSEWVSSRHFDVEAKVAGPDIAAYTNLDEKDRLAMMKSFLKERFNLQAHIDTKELQVYDLVLSKDGLKMKTAPPDPQQNDPSEVPKSDAKPDPNARHNGMMRMSLGTLSGTGLAMQQIASQLSYIVHHPVLDKTGLDGKYDIELKWADEYAPKQDNGNTDTAPSIFTAVQEQLGLKLQSTKGPVETLVIDHVEPPSEN